MTKSELVNYINECINEYRLLNESVKITKESAIKVIKTIGAEIEKMYNSGVSNLKIHEEHGRVYTEDNNLNEDNEKIIRVNYEFSTYNDGDEDWEHSFEYYESGNSDLSKEEVDRIINSYLSLMKKIIARVNQLITTYKNQGYDIKFEREDYRGDTFYIYIDIKSEEGKAANNVVNSIIDIYKSKIESKFNVKNEMYNTNDDVYIKGKYVKTFNYTYNIPTKSLNKTEFVNAIKEILLGINNLYKSNKDQFDKNFINASIYILDLSKYDNNLEVSLSITQDKNNYNPKKYSKIDYPEYCLNILLSNKMTPKIEPIAKQFFVLLDKKLKEKCKVNNNSISVTNVSNSVKNNTFSIAYTFNERDYKTPIFKYIRDMKSKDEAKEAMGLVKSSIEECISEISSKNQNIKIKQSWAYNGNLNYYFGLTIYFGMKYSDKEL